MQRRQQFLVEAGAHVAHPAQISLVVLAQYQRAEMRSRTFRRSETADDEFLVAGDFDFQPLAAAARFVRARSVFGHHALEAGFARRLQQLRAGARKGLGYAQRRARRHHLLEQLAAFAQAHPPQIVTIQVEQVEDEIDGRLRARQVRHGIRIGVRDARLDQVKLRNALGIEHRDFAIQHRARGGHLVRDHRQFRILPLAAHAAARCQPDFFIFDKRNRAHAIPLHLEQPLAAARRLVGQRGRHRFQGSGHLRGARAGNLLPIDSRSLPRPGRLRGGRGLGTHPRRRTATLPHSVRGASGLAFSLARRKVLRNLLLRAPGKNARRVLLHIPIRRGELVALLDDEPVVSLAAAFHVDQREIAVQLFTVQAEFQVAARQLFGAGDAAQQFERPAVPQHHAARAVIGRRNVAFEIAVLDRVILHVRREMLHRRIERRALRHRPRFQHAVDLQPEIIVQPGGIVPLHAEVVAGTLLASRRRLRSVAEAAYLRVLFKRHKYLYSAPFTSYGAL